MNITSSDSREKITIAGAGPVGSMLAIILARANYTVNLFESRSDLRKQKAYLGKSINLVLSDRAWLALRELDLEQEVKSHAIPLYKRIIHTQNGEQKSQQYGTNKQALWSISRNQLNECLLTQAEQEQGIQIHFEQRLHHLNFNTGCASFINQKERQYQQIEVEADLLFAADGAYSKVRRLAQETPRFSYSQNYMEQSYVELTIPADSQGNHQLDKHALHVWPRHEFMLIALPNLDGSFTCTLFLKHQGTPSFTSLNTPETINAFFQENFADVFPLLDNPIENILNKEANPLFLVSVNPWVFNNKIALIGDAAHAMVPFYGQGLNCSFEDCRELANLITQYQHDWQQILPAYQAQRKANADAISKLAISHFEEICQHASKAEFLLRKKIEDKFHTLHPDLWKPLYTMVSFSADIPYQHAKKIGEQQKLIMDEIMQIPNIHECWQQPFVYKKLKQQVEKKRISGQVSY